MGTIRPTFAEVRELARRGNIIPVTKVIPADWLTPVSAFLRLRAHARFPFLLESVEGGGRRSPAIPSSGRIPIRSSARKRGDV